jgi:aldehyde dehydrogenase (NAD+)
MSAVTDLQQQSTTETRQTLPQENAYQQIFNAQRAHHPTIAATDYRVRIKKLKKLLQTVREFRREIYQAMYDDFRKSEPEVDLTEILQVTAEIKHAIRHLKKWMKPKRVSPTLIALTTKSWIQYEPKGVVLILSPWNYPFNLTLGPVISAVAAGNCMMVKPSEFTPNSTKVIKKILEHTFETNEVAVIEGGSEVATELLKLPFNHIFFTGSPQVGKIVMRAAAEHLSSVTLELGGKSPVIISESANINDAAKKIVWGKYLNMGQTCIAPDYILVHQKVYEQFVDKVKAYIAKLYGEAESVRQSNTYYPRVVNAKHFQRLTSLLQEAHAKGATIESGGVLDENENYISPTILSNVSTDMRIMQEEIFGPILPLIPYTDDDEAIRFINRMEKPLALYIFSRRRKQYLHLLKHINSGGACINDIALHFSHLNLPFGGANHSGIGSSHGFYGFKAFSHERSVLKHFSNSPISLLFPPYTDFKKRLIKLLEKIV